MISAIFIILAAICSAVMDVIKHHWRCSIFSRISEVDEEFWHKWFRYDGWKLKYAAWDAGQHRRAVWFRMPVGFGWEFTPSKPTPLTNAWEFFKVLMVAFIILAIVFFPYSEDTMELFHNYWLNKVSWVALFWFWWYIPFNLFYKRLLRIKK